MLFQKCREKSSETNKNKYTLIGINSFLVKKICNASCWVPGCKVKLPTFATLKTFIYLTFFQPTMKIWMTEKNTVYEQPGIWTFSKLTVGMFWLKWTADIRTCHYLSKGSRFWQQPFNCVESDDDILLLNRIRNKQNQ